LLYKGSVNQLSVSLHMVAGYLAVNIA